MGVQLFVHYLISYLTAQLANLTTAIAQAEPADGCKWTAIGTKENKHIGSKIRTTHTAASYNFSR